VAEQNLEPGMRRRLPQWLQETAILAAIIVGAWLVKAVIHHLFP
jgi:hypothetical protein